MIWKDARSVGNAHLFYPKNAKKIVFFVCSKNID